MNTDVVLELRSRGGDRNTYYYLYESNFISLISYLALVYVKVEN